MEPIPDEVQLKPKIILRLIKATEPDVEEQRKALSDENSRYLEDKEKNAASSHIDAPSTKADRGQDWPLKPFVLARANDTWEREVGPHARVDFLDKDNILTDSHEKYRLQKTPVDNDYPPEDLLPIPGSFIARVLENARVTPADHWQDVRFLSLEVKAKENNRKDLVDVVIPGSTIVIFPKNYPSDVQKMIDIMEWNDVADRQLEWVPFMGPVSRPTMPSTGDIRMQFTRPSKIHAPDGASLRFLLTHSLDITAVPKRNFIRELGFFASSERERERLRELVQPGNSQEFYDYTSRPRRTILELLQDFPSVRIPMERAADLLPAIRGREFSIANGGQSLKGTDDDRDLHAKVLAALVEYKTVIRKPRQGLCSRYLKTLRPGSLVRIGINPSTAGPSCNETSCQRPLIAIATGTGIAPIRNLFEERDYFSGPNRPVGPSLLFFGCRNEAADFYFRNEWSLVPDLQVIPAFSRDPLPASVDGATDYEGGKNYVQHQIRRHAARVAELVAANAMVCLCGNSGQMPRAVREALLDALVLGGLANDRLQAEEIWKKVTFWQETW
jgi:sulfite reductase alpha subunit-like flavoprotein